MAEYTAYGYTAYELAREAGYELHPVPEGGVRERVVRIGPLTVRFLEIGPLATPRAIARYALRHVILPPGVFLKGLEGLHAPSKAV